MRLETRKIPESEPEMVEIRYHWITDEIQEIISFVKSRQGQLSAVRDGKRFEVPVVDLFYAESVDDRLFLYTAKDSYEIRMKLYELEDLLKNKCFFRVSKGMIVNLLNGQDLAETISQIIFAVFVGFALVILFRKGKSLVPCIVFHGVFNALSVVANDEALNSVLGGPVLTAVIMIAASAVLLGGYSLWNWKHLEG